MEVSGPRVRDYVDLIDSEDDIETPDLAAPAKRRATGVIVDLTHDSDGETSSGLESEPTSSRVNPSGMDSIQSNWRHPQIQESTSSSDSPQHTTPTPAPIPPWTDVDSDPSSSLPSSQQSQSPYHSSQAEFDPSPPPRQPQQTQNLAESMYTTFGGPPAGSVNVPPEYIRHYMVTRNLKWVKARQLAQFMLFLSKLRDHERQQAENAYNWLQQEQRRVTEQRRMLTDQARRNDADTYVNLLSDCLERLRLGCDIDKVGQFLRFITVVPATMGANLSRRIRGDDVALLARNQLDHERFIASAESQRVRATVSSSPYVPGIGAISNAHNGMPTALDQDPEIVMADEPILDPEEIEEIVEHARKAPDAMDFPPQMHVQELEHQRLGLAWLLRAERSRYKGGMLCDDMGLGKTVQAIALMYANPPAVPRGTDPHLVLIVCPVAMLGSWREELKARVHAPDRMEIYIHHGVFSRAKLRDAAAIRDRFDVVLTSYHGVSTEFKNRAKHQGSWPLFEIEWHRVILDESHMIRNANTDRSRACAALQARYRLCLTGTPMQNRPEDLFAQLRFLHVKHWGESVAEFKRLMRTYRFQGLDTQDQSWQSMNGSTSEPPPRGLAALLCTISLRRLKTTEINGRRIIDNLPEKSEEDRTISLEGDERKSYNELQSNVRRDAERVLEQEHSGGGGTQMHILLLLMRLRQAADHPRVKDCTAVLRGLGRVSVTKETVSNWARVAKRMDPDFRLGILTRKALGSAEIGFRWDPGTFLLCDMCAGDAGVAGHAAVLDRCGHLVCPQCSPDFEQLAADDDDEDQRVCPVADCGLPFRGHTTVEALILTENHVDWTESGLGEVLMNHAKEEAQRERAEAADRQRRLKALRNTQRPVYSVSDRDFMPSSEDEFSDSELGGRHEATREAPQDAFQQLVHGLGNGYQASEELDGLVIPKDEPLAELKSAAREEARRLSEASEPIHNDTNEHLAVDMVKEEVDNPLEDPIDGVEVVDMIEKRTESAGTGRGTGRENGNRNGTGNSMVPKKELVDPLEDRLGVDRVVEVSPLAKVFPDGWVSSAKIEAALDILREIWREDPTRKVIMFSAFTTMLSLLEIPLQAAMIGYEKYIGGTPVGQREQVLHQFRTQPECRCLLVSIMAGNAGLTLVESNRVIILDPFWNPYVEEQAKDRVYRIGQTRQVHVYRILADNTVEDRIIDLQKKKKGLIETAQNLSAQRVTANLSRDELLYALGMTRHP